MAGPPPEELLQRFNVSRESLGPARALRGPAAALAAAHQSDRTFDRRARSGGATCSMPCSSFRSFRREPRIIADLGSGAGIPGLVLAIAGQPRGSSLSRAMARRPPSCARRPGRRGAKARSFIKSGSKQSSSDRRPSKAGCCDGAGLGAAWQTPRPRPSPFSKTGAIGLFHKGQDVDAELTEAAKSWKIIAVKASKHDRFESRHSRGEGGLPCRNMIWRSRARPAPGFSRSPTRRAGSARPRPPSISVRRWRRSARRC